MQVSGRKQNIGARYKGGGYNGQNPDPARPKNGTGASGQKTATTDVTSYNVYNQAYNGKTYSVKYLGIVDGTMGILSRKMALTTADRQAITIQPGAEEEQIHTMSPQMHQIISEDNFTDVRIKSSNHPLDDGPDMSYLMQPVLGKKNYTETLGRNQRTQIIDDSTHMVHEPANFRIKPYGGQI